MKGCVIDCSFFIASLMPDENVNGFNFDEQNVFVPAIFFLVDLAFFVILIIIVWRFF